MKDFGAKITDCLSRELLRMDVCSFFVLHLFASALMFVQFPELLDVKGVTTLGAISLFFTFAYMAFMMLLAPWNRLRTAIACVVQIVLFLLLLLDVFLLLNFNTVLYPEVFNILEATDIAESKSFVETYLTVGNVGVLLAVGLALYAIIRGLAFLLSLIPRWLLVAVISSGLLLAGWKIGMAVYGSLRYGFGNQLAQYSTVTRALRSYYKYWQGVQETRQLVENIENFSGRQCAETCDIMIVVIGESYSKYHSSLYGYSRDTNPLLSQRVQQGMLVYSDVITPINDTERAVRAIYSLGEYYNDRYSDYALFPYVFKTAGWQTIYIDNIETATNTDRIKDSRRLSDLMYDYRNEDIYEFDEALLDLPILHANSDDKRLIVLKLWGQHYVYADRFPNSWEHYHVDDYSDLGLNDKYRQIVADYDNATRYNDYVIDKLIAMYENENACILYFSDHGEEVYDERNYMGHGGATPCPKIQVDVPFMIWMSDEYKAKNKDVVMQLQAHSEMPYTTDDVAHTILDMAGVYTDQLKPERSLANAAFQPRTQRQTIVSLIYEDLEE